MRSVSEAVGAGEGLAFSAEPGRWRDNTVVLSIPEKLRKSTGEGTWVEVRRPGFRSDPHTK